MMYNNLTFDKNQLALLILVKFFNSSYKETSELICTVNQLTGFHELWKNWD